MMQKKQGEKRSVSEEQLEKKESVEGKTMEKQGDAVAEGGSVVDREP